MRLSLYPFQDLLCFPLCCVRLQIWFGGIKECHLFDQAVALFHCHSWLQESYSAVSSLVDFKLPVFSKVTYATALEIAANDATCMIIAFFVF